MKDFELNALFITAAEFDNNDSEQLEIHDRVVLVSSVSSLCESKNFSNFDSVLFLSENNCSSLVSAHLMAEILEEEYKKRVRYVLLSSYAWTDAPKTVESVRMRDPFQEQLWIVIGSPQWMSRAVRALLPQKEEVPDLKGLVSGLVVCGYTYTNKELMYLYGHSQVSVSTELN